MSIAIRQSAWACELPAISLFVRFVIFSQSSASFSTSASLAEAFLS
jgi:hypothetical protein